MSRSAGNTVENVSLRSRARARVASAVRRTGAQRGAIDLATILVGVVVAGALTAGITAAVMTTIPWAQDSTAKQNLGLVTVAQSSADTKYDTFLGGDELINADMIEDAKGVSVRTNATGDCYIAFVTSPSSAVFYSTSEDTTAKPYVEGVTDTSWCADIGAIVDAPTSVAPVITSASLPAAHVATDYYKKVTASGLDPMTFSVTSGALPAGLSLNASTGVISGTPFFEGNTAISITASNVKGDSAPKTFTLNVTSVPSLTTVALPDGKVGTPYSTTLNAAGYPQSYTFEAIGDLPPGLSLNSATGVISGTPTEEADHTATFTVSNSPDPTVKSAPKSYPLTIGIVPTVTTKVLPATKIGTAYSATVEAEGHKGPYTFAIASGALPAGLTLATATGVISGTPTVQGPFTVGVTATSSFGTSAVTNVNVTVYATPAITTATLPFGVVDVAYSQTISATGTSAPTFAVTAGTLPAGLTLSAAGVLSGTPTTVSATGVTFTVTAENEAGTNAKAFTLVINQRPLITTASLPFGVVGVAYSQTIAATGTPAPTFSVTSGALPAGLALSAAGVLSGTPTTVSAAGVTFTVTATNITGTNAKAYTLVINSVPAITTATLPFGVVGVAYSQTISATGVPTPTFAVTTGSLPAGLTLSAGGLLSGTPTTQTAGQNFTVTATNVAGTDAQAYTFLVHTKPVITTASLPFGLTGVAYSETVAASGIPAPTFSVVAGTLPAGLTLSAAGVLSGTPTTVAASTFTIRATNAAGTDDKAFTMNVYTAPAITTLTLPNGKRTVAYSQTVVATGNPAPTQAVVAGALPTGLTFTAAGALSGTPTVTGTYTFTVRATNAGGFADRAYTMDIISDITPLVNVTVARSTTTGTAYNGAREAATVTVGGAACVGLTTDLSVTWTPATPAAQAATSATIATATRTGANTVHEVPGVANGAKGTMLISAKCSAWDAPITQSVAFNQTLPAPVMTITQAADAETHTLSWTDVSSLPVTFTVARAVPNAYAPSTMSTTTSALTYSSVQADGAVFGYSTTFTVTAALNGYSTSDTGVIANAWPASPLATAITYARTGTVAPANLYASGNMTWTMSGTCPAGTSRYSRYFDSTEYDSSTGAIISGDKNFTAYTLNDLAAPWDHGGNVKQGHPYAGAVNTYCNSDLTTSNSTASTVQDALFYTPQETPGRPVWWGYDFQDYVRGDAVGYATCRGYGGDMCGVKTDSMKIDYTDNCPTGSNPTNTYAKSTGWNGGTYNNTFMQNDGWELPNGISYKYVTYGSAKYTCSTRWRTSVFSSISVNTTYKVNR